MFNQDDFLGMITEEKALEYLLVQDAKKRLKLDGEVLDEEL